jgi:hypothetical protein
VGAGWPRGWRDPDVVGRLGPGEVRGPVEDADSAVRRERQAADGEAVGEVVGQDDGVDGAVLVGEADLLAAGSGGCGRDPGAGRVDGLAVAVQPGAQFVQRSLLEVGDAAGAVGADVDQQVAAVGDDVGQQVDQLGAGEGVGGGLLGVVPEGAAKAATELQGDVGAGSGVAYSWVWKSEWKLGRRCGSDLPERASALRARVTNRRYRPRTRRLAGTRTWVQRSLTTPSATVL